MSLQLIILCSMLLMESLVTGVVCPSSTCNVTMGSTAKSFAEQVIDLVELHWNNSLTICIYPGDYHATNGTTEDFSNFSNIVLQKMPSSDGEVVIRCPRYTSEGDYNGVGFFNAENISICNLSFTGCGPRTSGLFFQHSQNVQILYSTFRHNMNSGIGINFGKNFTISNCIFRESVGMQGDNISYLIETLPFKFGGAGLGISLENISDSSIVVKNCTFKNNIAYKRINNTIIDTRTYHIQPFGSGAAVYVRMKNVTRYSLQFVDCNFYNNSALHQGGAVAVFVLDSANNTVDIDNCTFIDNKAIGYLLVNQNYSGLVDEDSLKAFVKRINDKFNVNNFGKFIINSSSVSTTIISQAGGLAGSLLMAFYGNSEFNRLCIKNSFFTRSLAFGSGGLGFFIRSNLFGVTGGLNTNQAWIDRCNFSQNYALLGGAAFGVATLTRIDIAKLSAAISNSNFEGNVIAPDFRSSSFRFGINAVISTLHFPLSFSGTNVFSSNSGGCINTDNAQVDIRGNLIFNSNSGSVSGSALRVTGLAVIQLFPGARITADRNNALLFGGAIAVDSSRPGEDSATLLNYNCFLQYNIGFDDDQCPSNWKATISLNDNKAVEGNSVFVKDISGCTSTPCYGSDSHLTQSVYNSSLFNLPNIFQYNSSNSTSSFREFATAPSNISVDKTSIEVFPGEQFELILHIQDQNNNPQIALYTYPSNTLFTEAAVIEIDVTENVTDRSFAAADDDDDDIVQIAILVIRDSPHNFSYVNCLNNSSKDFRKESFTLQLIDSSAVTVVNEVTVMVDLKCCPPIYEYDKGRGRCMFKQGTSSKIIRGNSNFTYFYIKSEKYGEFVENGDLRTGRIPPFYQYCHDEAGLPGCLVKFDAPSHQCREGRTGFLCGQCPHQNSDNDTQGLAFNLLSCVTCDEVDVVLFVLICILIVVVSILIMYYNIGLPNYLRGFVYYAQVVGYVYVSGSRNGTLDWDFYLSRVFGFGFYFPLCLAHMEALQVASFGFLPPILILMSIISYTILARKMKPLSNKKTVDGIWFLILIIYVYTLDTCCNLLRCVETETHTNDFSETVSGSLVYYYDGSVKCFQNKHILYAVISVLTFVLFIIPFPFVLVAISWNYFKKTAPFCDVVNTGIKPVYNWWSGYDLFRRVLFVTVYYVFEYANGDYTRFAMFFFATIFLLISSRVCPYDEWSVNVVEWLMLLDLVLITAYFASDMQPHNVYGSAFGTFLFVLPYIFLLTYLVGNCFRKTKLCTVYRRRIEAIIQSISTYLGNTGNLQVIPNPIFFEDMSYHNFREELQVLRSDD